MATNFFKMYSLHLIPCSIKQNSTCHNKNCLHLVSNLKLHIKTYELKKWCPFRLIKDHCYALTVY